MKQPKTTIGLLLALVLSSHFCIAQVRRNVVEASQNQQALAANKAQLERDLAELESFKTKLSQFEKAFTNKNTKQIAALKTSLLSDMQREIKQSENKIDQDKREVVQSQSETVSSAKEVKRSKYDRATPDGDIGDVRDLRDDRRDRRGDQRDAQDDKNDLQRQIAQTNRQKEIYALLKAFTFSFEPSLQQKSLANLKLLQEFATTMEKDIAATQTEIAEDKIESREDARERREDVRELRERRRN